MSPFARLPVDMVAILDPRFARLVAELVARGLIDVRRDGMRATPEVVQFVEELQAFAGNTTVAAPVAVGVAPRCAPQGFVSVGTASRVLSVSEQRVRLLADRGRLGQSFRGDDRRWQIDLEAVEARRKVVEHEGPA